jgi:hypothetical protein
MLRVAGPRALRKSSCPSSPAISDGGFGDLFERHRGGFLARSGTFIQPVALVLAGEAVEDFLKDPERGGELAIDHQKKAWNASNKTKFEPTLWMPNH